MSLIGYHGSIKKSCYGDSIKWHCENSGVKCLQVVMKSLYKWACSKLKDADCQACRQYVLENDVFIVSHGSYLINMATACAADSKEMKNAVDDLRAVARIGGIGSVFHVGKHKKRDIAECLNNMEAFIREVIRQTPEVDTHFILETAAGQGSELCVKMEDFAAFYDRFSEDDRKRVRLCVDTCHIFAAGYDLTSPEAAVAFIRKFEDLIGWKYVDVVHLNDSKHPCGSKKDRHENICQGYVTVQGQKPEGLARFVYEMTVRDIPMVLETPNGTLEKPGEVLLVKKLVQLGAELVAS